MSESTVYDLSHQVEPKFMAYWEYDPEATVVCSCGWRGPVATTEDSHRWGLDVACAQCSKGLLVIEFPTREETEIAADHNANAAKVLSRVSAIDQRWEKYDQVKLKTASQLPDLPGAAIEIAWDLDGSTGDSRGDVVLRHEGREIWRELGWYECYERFVAVKWPQRGHPLHGWPGPRWHRRRVCPGCQRHVARPGTPHPQ